jgi:hypothetical protein
MEPVAKPIIKALNPAGSKNTALLACKIHLKIMVYLELLLFATLLRLCYIGFCRRGSTRRGNEYT